jgi:hypothetical protein
MQWRLTSSDAFIKCPTCLFEYRLRPQTVHERFFRVLFSILSALALFVAMGVLGVGFDQLHCLAISRWPNRGSLYRVMASTIYSLMGPLFNMWGFQWEYWFPLASVSIATDLTMCKATLAINFLHGFHVLGAMLFWCPLVYNVAIAVGNRLWFNNRLQVYMLNKFQEECYVAFVIHRFHVLLLISVYELFVFSRDFIAWAKAKSGGQPSLADWQKLIETLKKIVFCLMTEWMLTMFAESWQYNAMLIVATHGNLYKALVDSCSPQQLGADIEELESVPSR